MRLTIPGTFPTMNEIIEVSKRSPHAYNEMKTQYTGLVHILAMNKLGEIERIADFEITWFVKDRRKDKDNIMAGQKFIFDGLVQSGRMKNDGWKQIRNVTHRFEVDKANPRVEIEIKEVG